VRERVTRSRELVDGGNKVAIVARVMQISRHQAIYRTPTPRWTDERWHARTSNGRGHVPLAPAHCVHKCFTIGTVRSACVYPRRVVAIRLDDPTCSPVLMPSIATFLRAGVNVRRAAELLEQTIADYPDSAGLAADIRVCEHEGDQITHEVISRINQTFVTPIDREDILELASVLDDIVDYIDEVAEYLGLYRIEAPMEQAQQLAQILLAATRELSLALPLVRGFKDVTARVVEVHRLENEGDRIVRGAIASLFETGIDPMFVIRWKDIFERLENAIDATERAAYVLEGIIIKNT
jgi:uncharacterized protein